jgi:hypothetical protein
VAARSKACVCGRSPDGIAGSNPVGGMTVFNVSVVCCQAEIFATPITRPEESVCLSVIEEHQE